MRHQGPDRSSRTRRPTPSTAELYALYRQLHDAFGTQRVARARLYNVMKDLLAIRDRRARGESGVKA